MLSLEQVITTDRLRSRATRQPNLLAENETLHDLARAMVDSPRTVLQQLADATLHLCAAGSAGISLLEDSMAGEAPSHFRWVATAGRMAPFLGNTMPRSFSPCGSVLDANAMMLMNDPGRHFENISGLPFPLREVLLVPFHCASEPIGTLWIIAHDEDLHFDLEDARLVTSLSRFASVAVHVLSTAESALKLKQEACEAAERRVLEIAEQNDRLKESERNKLEFLATLAHELKNALYPLSNAAHIARTSDSPDLISRAQEILGRQLNQMHCLVNDLLDVAGISMGKLRLKLDTIDLGSLLHEALEMNRSTIERSGQTLRLQLPETPLCVRADPVRLFQILTNLFSNAAKYGAAGGVVDVSLSADDGDALICVKDCGIGIDSALLAKVFDLFVQGEHANKGLGIGLALVHRLVTMHGGEVSAHSDGIGKGCEFTVRLPLVDAA